MVSERFLSGGAVYCQTLDRASAFVNKILWLFLSDAFNKKSIEFRGETKIMNLKFHISSAQIPTESHLVHG